MRATPINAALGDATRGAPEPTVGMGATVLMWSDRHAATIVEVIKNTKGVVKAVVVQEDTSTALHEGGPTDQQRYAYAPNPEAPKVTYTRRKGGVYVRAGGSLKNGTRLRIGDRSTYYDPHF